MGGTAETLVLVLAPVIAGVLAVVPLLVLARYTRPQCESCGALLKRGASTCPRCHHARRACPRCGRLAPWDASRCPRCSAALARPTDARAVQRVEGRAPPGGTRDHAPP